VSPYAIRAIEGAPVAMPITWEDVDSEKLTAQSFPMKAALKQLEKEGQSWTGEEKKHDLGPAKEKLERLLEATRARGAENFLPLL
jgi:bifunctional non-homologous end joining protein LigD